MRKWLKRYERDENLSSAFFFFYLLNVCNLRADQIQLRDSAKLMGS